VYVDLEIEDRHRLQAGDLLLSRSGTLGRSFLIPDLPDAATFAGYLVRFRPSPRVHPRYLAYVAGSAEFQSAIQADAVSSTIQNFNAERYANIEFSLPSFEEQRRIADFLDVAIANLNLAISARICQIELLGTRFSALLDRIFRSAAGRSSRVKYATTRITSGPRGWGDFITDSHGSLFIRIANIPRQGIELDMQDSLYVSPPPGPERERTRTRPGDVLVSITADIGSVGIVTGREADANVSQHVALLRPDRAVCDPRWLAYSISSPQAKDCLRLLSYGGTKLGLGLSDVANLSIVLPSLSEQMSAVMRIDREIASMRRLEQAVHRDVALFSERKQALITAAVTGQIDVSTTGGVGVA
jgi:type I restriction enzyme S subunit